jgi:hypothetical protein
VAGHKKPRLRLAQPAESGWPPHKRDAALSIIYLTKSNLQALTLRKLSQKWCHPNFVPEKMVRVEGLEPPRLAAPEPKSGASTNFATPAHRSKFSSIKHLAKM